MARIRVMTEERRKQVLIDHERRFVVVYRMTLAALAEKGLTCLDYYRDTQAALDGCNARLRSLGVDPETDPT